MMSRPCRKDGRTTCVYNVDVVDDQGRHVPEGHAVLYVGVGQPDARTEALTGHPAVRVDL